MESSNPKARLDEARKLLKAGRVEEAQRLLDSLSGDSETVSPETPASGSSPKREPSPPAQLPPATRFPRVVAVSVVLVAAVGAGLYLALRNRNHAAHHVALARAAAPLAPSPASRDQIVKQASDDAAQAALREEEASWNRAVANFGQDRLGRAAAGFQQVVAMGVGSHQAAAESYLRKRIPAAKKDDILFRQAKSLAQHGATSRNLLEARQDLRQVVRDRSPHAAQAAQLEASISSRVVALHNQRRFERLVSEFDGPASNNPQSLRRLETQFRRLESADGAIGDQAQQYVEVRIPEKLRAMRRNTAAPAPAVVPVAAKSSAPPAAPAARRYLWVVSLHSIPTPAKWKGSLTPGQKVGEAYVDGGVKLQGHPLPMDLVAQAAQKNSQFRLLLSIDPQGHVSGGRLLSGDPSLGQSLLTAAEKSWQFAPPRVNATPVATSATFDVYF